MDNELNQRLRSVLRELREVTVKLECQLAVAASEAAEAVNGLAQAVKAEDPWACDCTHPKSMHGNLHGCYELVSETEFCHCTVLNP